MSSRRTFLKTTGAAAVTAACGPILLGAEDKAGVRTPVIGTGGHTYECHHGWGEVPDHIRWGDTHGVAVDEAGLIYIKHRSNAPTPMDAIAVFEPTGRFVRSFGKHYHGGGHGIDIRKEGSEEFLYLCDVKHGLVEKSTLKGEVVWSKGVPQEPDVYKPDSKYSPTNVCFGPDGGFYIADGYGSHYIHQYDKDAKWVRTWGGQGTELGKMRTPHGIWLDNRPGREASIVVADRANARLQYFTLDGKPLSVGGDVSFPAHFDIRDQELLVPDLHTRVTILDKNNQVIIHLGEDPQWRKHVVDSLGRGQTPVRTQPQTWPAGKFIHPHDACYDRAGNIFVVEWVPTGRVSFLTKVA
jgi:hypothetical protein